MRMNDDSDEALRRQRWGSFIGKAQYVNALVAGHVLAILPAVFGFQLWTYGYRLPEWRDGWHDTFGVLCVLSCFAAWVCILSAFLA
jgi:hypothetical protein